MSETGLENFDRTLQKTHRWLKDVGDVVGPDKQYQYQALRSVLWALRDRLSIEEAFHLSSHLPILVRGVYWESYRPAGKPERYRSQEAFLQKVSGALEGASPMKPEDAARAVFAAIARNVPGGEIEDVMQMLPEDVRTLFPQS